jgi:alkanesulfonate monooxygenase SsuD/methylene tetrahydromethanopterin reductase-like flavin-dependent oxidoreductase (luciferase family)
LQDGVKKGDYQGSAHLVPDEMAQTFVVCGSPDEVRRRVEPVWEAVDSLTLVPPVGLAPDKQMAYAGAIASTFYV